MSPDLKPDENRNVLNLDFESFDDAKIEGDDNDEFI